MKRIITVVAIVVFIAAILFFFKFFKGENVQTVSFDNVDTDKVPDQITQVLPNYRTKEKALVAKVNDEIYVIVTRGEKNSAGYDVEIESLDLSKTGGENVLTVKALYTDPKPGDVTAQILTYPFVVVKTSMTELPQKVVLEKDYKH